MYSIVEFMAHLLENVHSSPIEGEPVHFYHPETLKHVRKMILNDIIGFVYRIAVVFLEPDGKQKYAVLQQLPEHRNESLKIYINWDETYIFRVRIVPQDRLMEVNGVMANWAWIKFPCSSPDSFFSLRRNSPISSASGSGMINFGEQVFNYSKPLPENDKIPAAYFAPIEQSFGALCGTNGIPQNITGATFGIFKV